MASQIYCVQLLDHNGRAGTLPQSGWGTFGSRPHFFHDGNEFKDFKNPSNLRVKLILFCTFFL